MVQVRKFCFYGISAIFLQCYFMSETQVLMAGGNNSYPGKGALFFNGSLFFSWGTSFLNGEGVPHGMYWF